MQDAHASRVYWHKQAAQFIAFYQHKPILWSPLSFVRQFLSDRTKKLIAYAPSNPRTVMLDLGCGSGEQMKYFIPKCRYVYGLDYSRQMIQEAKKELHLFPKKKYRLILADAHHIPLKNHTINIVIAMGLLDYVNSPKIVIKECSRILKPNGILVASIPKQPSLFSLLRTPFGNTLRKYIFHLPPIQNTITKKNLHQLFISHGFTVQTITSVWGAMWMVKAKLASQGDALRS